MLNKIIVPITILLAANYFIKKYLLIEKVTFLIKKINFNNNILNPVLILTIQANNPIGTQVKITDLVSDIFVNRKKVGTASNNETIIIAPKKSSTFDLRVSILPITTIATIFDIFKNFGGEVKLTGSTKVDGINFPVDINYNF